VPRAPDRESSVSRAIPRRPGRRRRGDRTAARTVVRAPELSVRSGSQVGQSGPAGLTAP